jgi:metal-responsive CopG/Arc/MetJ family transcriptional regulator
MEIAMATVNFSVPDDVKAAFDRTFKGQNKSAVIAELMRRAVKETKLKQRREEIFRSLTESRSKRPSLSNAELRAIRRSGRP